jgi:hypothetical protein
MGDWLETLRIAANIAKLSRTAQTEPPRGESMT